jgi:hypothetical protein
LYTAARNTACGEGGKEGREPDGSRVFLFLAVQEVQRCKKEDAGSESTQEKIQRNLPVPDIEMRIHQRIHAPADDNFFSHMEFTYAILNQKI